MLNPGPEPHELIQNKSSKVTVSWHKGQEGRCDAPATDPPELPRSVQRSRPRRLAAGHHLTSIGSTAPPSNAAAWDGLEHLSYSWPEGYQPTAQERGVAVAKLCRRLHENGLVPDLVIAHCGWGETLHLAGIWTGTPLVVLPELWGSARALGFGFDPALPASLADSTLFDEQNAIAAKAIEQSQAALVACHSQRASFPEPLRRRITVLPEGLPMEQYGSNPRHIYKERSAGFRQANR